MPAIAEFQSTVPHGAQLMSPRVSNRLVCSICADTMVAAEASSLSEGVVSYLWTCDTCGHGFVTRHNVKNGTDT